MYTRSKTRALSLLLLLTLFFVPIAGAVSNSGNINANLYKAPKNHNTGEELFEEMRVNAELYNQYFDNNQIPRVKMLVSGFSEDVLVKIKLENGKTLSVTFTTNKGKINLNTFSMDDKNSKFKPSVTVKTNEETVREVLNSKDLTEILKFIINGSIKVDGESCFQKIVLHTLEKML